MVLPPSVVPIWVFASEELVMVQFIPFTLIRLRGQELTTIKHACPEETLTVCAVTSKLSRVRTTMLPSATVIGELCGPVLWTGTAGTPQADLTHPLRTISAQVVKISPAYIGTPQGLGYFAFPIFSPLID
jgi:hypothetical protein